MMGIKISTDHLLLIVIVTFCEILPCTPKISDKRLCYDDDCSVPIAEAKTVSLYHSRDKDILSFPINADVIVFSKEAGNRQDLWGVEIRGKRGYAPKSFIREKKVLHKPDRLHEVPTERVATENISKDHRIPEEKVSPELINNSIESGNPSPITPQVAPSFEIVDGTTLHFSNENEREEEQILKSYATKIRSTPDLSEEQPVLSVHPNVVSSEVNINEDLSSETGDLPLKIENEGQSPEVSDSNVGEQKGKDSQLNKNEVLEKTEEKNVEKLEDNSVKTLENDEIPDRVIEVVNEEIPTDGLANEGIIEGVQDDKKTFPEEIVEVMPQGVETIAEDERKEFTQSSESVSVTVDKPEEEPSQDYLSSAIQTMTSMFDSLSTTDSPLAEPIDSAEEEISTDTVSPPEQIPKIVEDKIPKTVSTPEIIPETIPVTEKTIPEAGVTEPTIAVAVSTTEEILSEGMEENSTVAPIVPTLPDVRENSELINGDVGVIKTTYSSNPSEVDNQLSSNNETIAENVKETPIGNDNHVFEENGQPGIYRNDELSGPSQRIDVNKVLNFNGFPNRNLLNVQSAQQRNENMAKINENTPPLESVQSSHGSIPVLQEEKPLIAPPQPSAIPDVVITEEIIQMLESTTEVPEPPQDHLHGAEPPVLDELKVPTDVEQLSSSGVCEADGSCPDPTPQEEPIPETNDDEPPFYDTAMGSAINFGRNYWEALSYVALTAFTTLLFSLGYYYIENRRRDGEFIAKINKLEKELLVSTKECSALDESLKSTKNKLTSIEDESFGSNEMVLSLKIELDNAHKAKSELEDQVAALEKDLEGATEAGLELERMLREILASNSAENPLARSVEDLQARLSAQQAANESLTNALHLKTQEGETLSRDLALAAQKCEQLEVEVTRITEELRREHEVRSNVEGESSKKVGEMEKQLRDISAERINLRKQLRGKEMELKDLLEVVKQANTHNIDFDKLADVSHVKAEAIQLTEDRDELRIRLKEVEGAHQLLEEHMRIINEEVGSLSEQCKLAEKEKREAETRLEVLSNFFKAKEAERQKEEAVWLQQQGEVSSTVERLQTMHNEIMGYKQQMESLKREILDQEREYKNQITSLESKAHEQWVLARQNERRLEESKSEAAQLRNRLTMIEKNLNDSESDVKLHRMEANGDPATSPLFLGAEASSSPIMFSGTSGPPPPPPSYLYGPPLPPYMPPPLPPPLGLSPYDVSQRPPPLGGRLASPPPMPPLHLPSSGRYDGPGSLSPPPHSPPLVPYRNFPAPFGNERIPPPLPPLWGDDALPPARNTGFHPFHRDHQRTRDKGSLHSSGESLDKSHHSAKV